MKTKNIFLYIASLIITFVVVVFMIQHLRNVGQEQDTGIPADANAASIGEGSETIPSRSAAGDDPADRGGSPSRKVDSPAKGTEKAITVYVTRWCPYCRKATGLLDQLGARYTVKDIEKDPKAGAEMLKKTRGMRGVPVVDIGGTIIHGFDPPAIKKALNK